MGNSACSRNPERFMRCILLLLLAPILGCGGKSLPTKPDETGGGDTSPSSARAEEPTEETLHSEQGVAAKLEIERHGPYTRLVVGGVLHGSQFNERFKRHWRDDFAFIVPGSPWDVLLTAGMFGYFNPREEPLTYYTRTGPVGAIFGELRCRKVGKDAKSPVAILGMKTGTLACYALPAQSFTFYETDPALIRLVANTDKYFTHITDARKRGATIEIRVGNRRNNLEADRERKYSLLIVDPFDSEEVPVDLLTKEAVQLYSDRLTDDGILAMHLSSKPIVFDPMIARIALELKLVARVWEDHTDQQPGKTWSTWAVLARSEQALGTLALPLAEQKEQYNSEFRPIRVLPGVPAWRDGSTHVVPGMRR
jgi:hypothetical protein